MPPSVFFKPTFLFVWLHPLFPPVTFTLRRQMERKDGYCPGRILLFPLFRFPFSPSPDVVSFGKKIDSVCSPISSMPFPPLACFFLFFFSRGGQEMKKTRKRPLPIFFFLPPFLATVISREMCFMNENRDLPFFFHNLFFSLFFPQAPPIFVMQLSLPPLLFSFRSLFFSPLPFQPDVS